MFGADLAVQIRSIESKKLSAGAQIHVEPTYLPLNGCDLKLTGRIPFLRQMCEKAGGSMPGLRIARATTHKASATTVAAPEDTPVISR